METIGQFLWYTVGVILTLCIFSFLIRDNPFYKFAERLVAGVAAGYWTMLIYWTLFHDKVIDTMASQQWAYVIPILLGIGMWMRFSRNYAWISRYSIAFYIGISTGVSVPVFMYTAIFKQMSATIIPFNTLTNVLVIIGVLCALFYFFFSKAHTGVFGVASRIGIYILMVGFGAGFGLTVMGRVALLVQRIIYMKDYVRGIAAYFGG